MFRKYEGVFDRSVDWILTEGTMGWRANRRNSIRARPTAHRFESRNTLSRKNGELFFRKTCFLGIMSALNPKNKLSWLINKLSYWNIDELNLHLPHEIVQIMKQKYRLKSFHILISFMK